MGTLFPSAGELVGDSPGGVEFLGFSEKSVACFAVASDCGLLISAWYI